MGDGVETPVLSSLSETTPDDDSTVWWTTAEDEDTDHEEAASFSFRRRKSEKGSKSVWTFAHTGKASSFVWDPTLGIESAESDKPDDGSSNDQPEDGENQIDDGNLVSGANSFSMCFLALLPVWASRINF